MLKKAMMTALIAAPLICAAPAFAQNAAQNGVLIIYGNDKCPTNDHGEEIVVCHRLDESERFRIPKTLREAAVKPQNESWAVRQQDALNTGQTGIGSCSAVGVGGSTGCLSREIKAAKAEAKARKADADALPLP